MSGCKRFPPIPEVPWRFPIPLIPIVFLWRTNLAEFSIDEADNAELSMLFSEKRKLEYEGTINLTPDGRSMFVKTNSFNMILLDTETQQELVNIVSVGQSRIVDENISTDGDVLVLACFDNFQVIDMSQMRNELANLNLDW